MKSNIQEKVNELQLRASEFLTSSKLSLNRLTIYPKEIEVYYYKDGEFEDNSVHKNELQKNNQNHLYIHRRGIKRTDSYKGGNRVGIDFVVSNDDSIYYSYLLRSCVINGLLVTGPHNVLESIKEASGLSNSELEDLHIAVCQNETHNDVLFSKRIHLGKKVNEEYLGCKLRAVLCDEYYKKSKYPLKEGMIIDFLCNEVHLKKMNKDQAFEYAKEHLDYIPPALRKL
ncbi:MAG: hypothetical protein LKF48_05615 [Prevotella sp.]|jgi:hypothetical protein|nr:hypothetical protein [Prevotella sp.]MCH4182629.1 hypothetical protein [Prevotella sp.]MCH4211992.1 hypothetical protein [Prevotella sp.]MCH4241281.1 hypothetical protein [Prevotella sp.]MCI1741690.1 hypothetical protein [Prevotella sp.]